MVASKGFEPPDIVVVTVSGVMSARDQGELTAWVRHAIRTIGPVRVLVLLKDFAGWRLDPSADVAALWLQDHEAVVRLAIVGDPAQRLSVLTAIAQPVRRMPIEYFTTETAARVWLEGPPQGRQKQLYV
jgi:hypothetical protein